MSTNESPKRGALTDALRLAVTVFLILMVVAGIGGAILSKLPANQKLSARGSAAQGQERAPPAPALPDSWTNLMWEIVERMALFALCAGIAAGLGRLIFRSATARFRGSWVAPADYGWQIGLIAALLAVGWLSDKKDPAEIRKSPGPAVELAGPTLESKELKLSDLRGKVVVVDFWATWCGPCRAELPNMKKIYRKYHDRGLEVVGISLDDDRKALTSFVHEENIPWQQIFFENPGDQSWQNPLVRKFGIRAIPHTFVVDREGRLADDNLVGRALESAVGEEFGEPAAPSFDLLHILKRMVGWIMTALLQASPLLLMPTAIGFAAAGSMIEGLLVRRKLAKSAKENQ